jgi:hypothetical protein
VSGSAAVVPPELSKATAETLRACAAEIQSLCNLLEKALEEDEDEED